MSGSCPGDSVSVGFHYATVQILAMAVERAGSFDSFQF